MILNTQPKLKERKKNRNSCKISILAAHLFSAAALLFELKKFSFNTFTFELLLHPYLFCMFVKKIVIFIFS